MAKYSQTLIRSTDSIPLIRCYGFVLMSHNDLSIAAVAELELQNFKLRTNEQ